MAFELQEASISDMDELAKLFLELWEDDYLLKSMMLNTPFAEQQAFWAAAFRDYFKKSAYRTFKIVDSDARYVCSIKNIRSLAATLTTNTGSYFMNQANGGILPLDIPSQPLQKCRGRVRGAQLPNILDVELISDFFSKLDKKMRVYSASPWN
jgi:hypothetical protein